MEGEPSQGAGKGEYVGSRRGKEGERGEARRARRMEQRPSAKGGVALGAPREAETDRESEAKRGIGS